MLRKLRPVVSIGVLNIVYFAHTHVVIWPMESFCGVLKNIV